MTVGNPPASLALVRSRREVLKMVGAAAALVGVGACSSRTDDGPDNRGGGAASAASRPTDPSATGPSATGPSGSAGGASPSGVTFSEPQVLSSRDGVLEVVLEARPSQVPYAGGTRFAYTYNGTSPGPTLRVRPGDELRVTLRNGLEAPTNLHTHGLHVSPEGDGDNIFVSVAPGASHTYRYRLPADHRSGLFWYHPHEHGSVARQLAGGLAGAIIVEDAIDEGALAASTERLLVLSDPRIGDGPSVLDVSRMEQMQGREGDLVLVNGLSQPLIDCAAGTVQRWRLLNAGASRTYRLALEGLTLSLLGTDGGRLAAPVAVEELLLAPGERAEVLFAPGSAGTWALEARPYDRGGPGMGMGAASSSSRETVIVASARVSGDAAAAALPTGMPAVADLRDASIDGERTLVLAMGMGGGGMGGGGMGGGGMGSMFTIDGKSFDPGRTDITARLGTVEEWTIRNTSTMDHPFHLHVWPFQIVGLADGSTPPRAWKDTVNVPAGAWVRIRLAFVTHPGRTVYHCHILDHEDLGMMGTIEVR